MKITFATLPQFKVLEIKRTNSVTRCSGIIKNIVSLSKAKPEWIVTICASQNKFIQGRFSEIDSKTFHVTIDLINLESPNNIIIGNNYPLLDGYWGNLVELVLNTSIIWKRVKFEPSDSIIHHPDGRVEIVKDGWEHEHCEICSQTISQYKMNKNSYSYVSKKDNWLCESCYEKYVQEKSINFINLNQLF